MAMKSGIFTSLAQEDAQGNITYDRAVDEDFLAAYMKGFFTDGVFPYPTDGFQVLASTGMAVSVNAGKAMIDGRFCYDESTTTLTISAAHASFTRYDRVVLRLDYPNRAMGLHIKTGTEASSPVVPALTRTSDIWEICLATITVPKGMTAVSQSVITDTRRDSTLCGIVSPITNVIASSDFEAQLNSVFLEWFEVCKSTLTTDSAGKLLIMIQDIEESMETKLNAHISTVSAEKKAVSKIICARWTNNPVPANDIVRVNSLDNVPLRVAFNGGVLSADWGEVRNDAVTILKPGWYFVSLNTHISDSPGMQGTYHVRIYNYSTGVNIAEQYVKTTDRKPSYYVSGCASNLVHIGKNQRIFTMIAPPRDGALYRISALHTYVTVAPYRLD